jgi:hypothetical protein
MRSPLDALLTRAALDFIATARNQFLTDALIDQEPFASSPVVKNVCAKLSVALSDEIDSVCSLLDISKRAFIEAALQDALQKAKAVIESEGVFQAHDESLERHELAKAQSDASRALDANE